MLMELYTVLRWVCVVTIPDDAMIEIRLHVHEVRHDNVIQILFSMHDFNVPSFEMICDPGRNRRPNMCCLAPFPLLKIVEK